MNFTVDQLRFSLTVKWKSFCTYQLQLQLELAQQNFTVNKFVSALFSQFCLLRVRVASNAKQQQNKLEMCLGLYVPLSRNGWLFRRQACRFPQKYRDIWSASSPVDRTFASALLPLVSTALCPIAPTRNFFIDVVYDAFTHLSHNSTPSHLSATAAITRVCGQYGVLSHSRSVIWYQSKVRMRFSISE